MERSGNEGERRNEGKTRGKTNEAVTRAGGLTSEWARGYYPVTIPLWRMPCRSMGAHAASSVGLSTD
jgi:hypothetical protein